MAFPTDVFTEQDAAPDTLEHLGPSHEACIGQLNPLPAVHLHEGRLAANRVRSIGAFVLDPDGNNLEVVCHSPA